ncbi:MAG: hypothetical protein JEZ14_01350 [Marinilabiliaceae bacterium]|nr:hypothetical protein [Marinilabiliaceae bacterium]
MKKAHLLYSMIGIIAFGFSASTKLKMSWSTPQALDVPESVLYHTAGDYLFVSNISGKPAEKNGAGFISRLSTDGKIQQLKWVTGLNAPKGMASTEKQLFVSDIDALVIINIKQAKIEHRIEMPAAKFLNDVTITTDGDVYVSDSGDNRIYKLEDDKLISWQEGDHLQGVNGLLAENNVLLVGTRNKVLKYNLQTNEYSTFIDQTCSVDGIEADGRGGYFFSAWRGELYHWTPDSKPTQLLDTADQNINCADIGYDTKNNRLLVPTFFNNRVIAYQYN